MENGGKTLMFPLSALSLLKSRDIKELATTIIRYGCYHAGLKMVENAGGPEAFMENEEFPYIEVVENICDRGVSEDYFRELVDDVVYSLVGCWYCDVIPGDKTPDFSQYYYELNQHSKEVVNLTDVNGDSMVRMHKNLVFDVKDEGALSPIAFRILCGLYSFLGDAEYKFASASQVALRSTGAMKKPTNERGRKLLLEEPTLRQTRYWLTKLWNRNFVRRVHAGKSNMGPESGLGANRTYYSRRAKTDEELAKIIKSRKPAKKRVSL